VEVYKFTVFCASSKLKALSSFLHQGHCYKLFTTVTNTRKTVTYSRSSINCLLPWLSTFILFIYRVCSKSYGRKLQL